MKRMLVVFLAMAAAGAAATMLVSQRLNARHASERAALAALWAQEKADLEAAVADAKAAAARRAVQPATLPAVVAPTPVAPPDPVAIVARLRALRANAGVSSARMGRQIIYALEELIAIGPSALPAIREFLSRNEDVDYDLALAAQGKSQRGTVPNDFVLPPSLRFGLLDATRQIGGAEAEAILADILGSTGRGVELAWLARVLQELVPNKYRDVALTAARELLSRPVASAGSPLDRNDREHLFNVLSMYGDKSYVTTAQSQLVQADGVLDRNALRYLQQTLGSQAVPVAAQLFDDPRLTDPAHREPLARLALNFVGTDVAADEFYQKAINDLALSKGHRKNLIEDLNQDGFPDLKNLTLRDLPLIENRISLIERLAPGATDPVNVAAFKEAYKDLVNMRARIQQPRNPAP